MEEDLNKKLQKSLENPLANNNINTIMSDINTEVQLLKKEVSDMKMIFSRLDVAIEKISDVSNCVNRMLSCNHEEKISQPKRISN